MFLHPSWLLRILAIDNFVLAYFSKFNCLKEHDILWWFQLGEHVENFH